MDFMDLKAQQELIKTSLDRRISKVLSHGKYIMGPEVKELETKLSEYTGAKHVISCANGTDALQLALMAIDIKPGDEVITTPFTFIAAAETIALAGAVPVFVDIDPKTYLLDASRIEEAITYKTRAIIPVSLYGQCADMKRINDIAEKYSLTVIEDAAQSFGATQHGKRSCNLSKLATTSFFPSKPLGCYGDGGAVFTSDGELAEKISALRIHGQSKRYLHPWIGINSRLDTIQAAVLLTKLEIFDKEVEAREEIGARYSEALADIVKVPFVAKENTSVYGQYTIAVSDRDDFRAYLQEKGVPTTVHYPKPIDQQPAFKEICRVSTNKMSLKYSESVVSLPMHPYLTIADQDSIIKATKEFHEKNIAALV